MKQKLVIVRGTACSGKTTISREIRDYDRKIAWLNIDKFKEIFSPFKDEALDDVHESAFLALPDLLDRGFSVVADGIFKKPKYIEEIRRIASDKKVPLVIYQLECSLETLKKRDKERWNGHWKPLGDELIESLYNTVKENPISEAIPLNTEEKSIDECIKIVRKNFE